MIWTMADWFVKSAQQHLNQQSLLSSGLEDNKLCWFKCCCADFTNQSAIVQIILSHGAAVTTHEPGRFFGAQQAAVTPLIEKESVHRVAHVFPEPFKIGRASCRERV